MVTRFHRYSINLNKLAFLCYFFMKLCLTSYLVRFAVTTDKMTKKKPRFGALPKLNMPVKSHESRTPPERPHRAIVKDDVSPQTGIYKSLPEVCRGLKDLKSLTNWSCKSFENKIVVKKIDNAFLLPQIEIVINESLGFTVKVFGCFLPDDHPLYLTYKRSVGNITVKSLVNELDEYKLCCGVTGVIGATANDINGKLFHHVIPKHDEENEEDQGIQFPIRHFGE